MNDFYAKAYQAYLEKDYAKASEYFSLFRKDYLVLDEFLASAIYYQGEAFSNSGQYDEAITSYRYVINNFTFSNFRDKATYKVGLLYYEKHDYTSAQDFFLQLNDDYPNSEFYGSSLYWIGEANTRLNKVEEAINYFKEAISYKQTNKFVDNSIYSLARLYEEIGDFTNAVTYYDELLSFYRESPLASQAQIRIGICYFHLKEYDSSILELSNPLVKQLPPEKQSEALYLLANSYYRVGEYANAEKVYREVIQKYPASSFIREVKYAHAWSIFQQKKYLDAFKLFSVLSLDDDSIGVKSFYWKGEAKRYAGNEREALIIYEDFLKKCSESELVSSALYQIGVLLYTSGEYEKAAVALSKGVNTKDAEVRAKILTMLGEIELQKKRYQSALQYFNKIKESEIEDQLLVWRGLLGKGITLYYLNNYDEALSVLSDLDFRAPNFESAKVTFYLAECFFAKKDFSQALSNYNKVSTDEIALQSLTLYGKAYCYFNQKDYTNASFFFSDFIKRFPQSEKVVDAKIRMADSYFADKSYAEASNAYAELLKVKNGIKAKDYVSFQYALALYRSGSVQKAIAQLDEFKSQYAKSSYYENALYLSGWIKFQQNNFDGAIVKYRSVLEELPNSKMAALIQYSIGDAFYNLGNYDSAIVSYETVITNYPNSTHVFDALNGIQYCYVAKGEMDKAIQLIDNYVSENPTANFADQLYFKKGELFYNQRDYEKARLSYKDFITYFSGSKYIPNAYYQIGKCEQFLNNLDEAVQNYKVIFNSYKQSEIAPGAVIELGNVYAQQKKFDQALSLYDKAIETYRNTSRISELLFMKGDTQVKKNDPAAAYDVFEEVAMYYPTTIFADKAKLEMGLIELKKKRFENADKLFLELVTKRTDDIGAKAQYSYGVSLLDQGKTQNAITAFVRVINVYQLYDEWMVKSYLRLGDAYLKMNDKNKAKEMYRTVISTHRGDEYGKEAQQKLRSIK